MSSRQIYDVTAGLKSKYTKTHYKWAFSYFLDKYLKNRETPISLLEKDPKLIEAIIIEFIEWMAEEKKLTHNSIVCIVPAVEHFFEINDILLNKRKINRFIPDDEDSKEDRAYTHKEISKLLSVATDERIRVAILLMSSTGMRIGALPDIRVCNLKKIPEYNLYKITVHSKSKKGRYYTFCTPECASAIDSYLEYRKRCNDPCNPESPLIREQFEMNDPIAAQHPRKLERGTPNRIINVMVKRSGIGTRGEVKNSHGFRKFAITQMIKAKVDFNTREFIVGHKLSRGLDYNYDRTSEEDRLEEYLKAVNFLTINEENRLRKQVAEQEYTIKVELEQQRKQNEALHKRVKVMEQYVKLYGHPEFHEKLKKGIVVKFHQK